MGRNVIAYMSSIHVDPDLVVDLFVMEPVDQADSGESLPVRTEEPSA
jgi:hypothetical protein